MICVSALKGAAFLTTWNVAPLPPTHTNTLLTEAKLYFSWVSLRACLLISALPLFFSALESLFLLTVRESFFDASVISHGSFLICLSTPQRLSVCPCPPFSILCCFWLQFCSPSVVLFFFLFHSFPYHKRRTDAMNSSSLGQLGWFELSGTLLKRTGGRRLLRETNRLD